MSAVNTNSGAANRLGARVRSLVGTVVALAFVGGLAMLIFKSCQQQMIARQVVAEYLTHLREGRMQKAYAMLTNDKKDEMSYEAFLLRWGTPVLQSAGRFSHDFSNVSTDFGLGFNGSRGCVSGSVKSEGDSYGVQVFFRQYKERDDSPRIHHVTVFKRGRIVTRVPREGPWSCTRRD